MMAEGRLGKLARLRAMTVSEIVYRLRERVALEAERIRLRAGVTRRPEPYLLPQVFFEETPGVVRGPRSNGYVSSREYLDLGPASRFYLPADRRGRERLRELVARHFPHWIREAVEEAEKLCRHRVPLLGYGEIDLGPEIDWHRDPLTGRSWPLRFWADYDLVRDASAGDPKRIHELNRHQHLPRLAKAYFYTGEERYAREALAQIESWIERNPEGRGINWHSSLEIGLRAISWLWTIFPLLSSRSFQERAGGRILRSLYAQVSHIDRYPSSYSSPNTHLLGEATALFIAGVLFEELEAARSWRTHGEALLIQEMEKQVSEEGLHQELSSYYHCYTLDFYLQALSLAVHNSVSFPDWVWNRFSLLLYYLLQLTRSDGTIPLVGDDDGGRALALRRNDYGSFSDALCSGAVIFQRGDYKQRAGEFCEETLWMLGERAWRRYSALAEAAPLGGASFPGAGYFIQRSRTGEVESQLIFDCGGLGMLRGGHGHADALSLVLSAGGEELLVDPGTYLYNGPPEWRNFFRSTRAHNTVVVDGRDQSEPGGMFDWKTRASSRLLTRLVLPGIEYVEGEHQGYAALAGGVTHRRRLLHPGDDYWIVADDLRGQGRHTFDFYYHFSPQAETVLRQDGAPNWFHLAVRGKQAGLNLSCFASGPPRIDLLHGETAPIQGWVSRRYGQKQAAPVLRARLLSSVPAGAISILMPFALAGATAEGIPRTGVVRSCPASNGRFVACTIQYGERTDLAVLSLADSELQVMDFRMCGEFFWLRMERGMPVRLLAISAHSFRHKERAVFETRERLPHVFVRFSPEGLAVESSDLRSEFPCVESAA